MTRLNYSARKINGIKAGQVLARDLKKRSATGSAPKATVRDPCLEIDISRKQLTDQGFAQFADELIHALEHEDESSGARLRLQELHLAGNELSVESLEKLARVVALGCRDLRELDLSANCIQVVTSREKELWESFLHAFDGCFVLKKLDLSGNPIGAAGLEAFVRVYVRSELDFVVDDEGGRAEPDEELQQQRLDVDKENVRQNGGSPAQTPRRAHKGCSPTAPENSLKRYACTRGLRSVPFIILSNISMTDASAVLLAAVLNMHSAPDRLMEFLPPGKSITVPKSADCAGGIVWLPNGRLSSPACDLLRTAEKLAQPTVDDGDDSDLHESLNGLSIREHREMTQKLDTMHARLLKRVRLEALATEGVHSVQLWSIALKMIVVSRALLLDDKTRLNLSQAASNGSARTSQPTGARLTCGPFHPDMDADTFDAMFPALGAVASSSGTAKRGALTQKATKAVPEHRAMVTFRFGLPLELWRRIIAEAVGAEGILSRAQQDRVLEYVTNWGSLEQEMSVSGAAEHQQIWKMLESVGCFEYEG